VAEALLSHWFHADRCITRPFHGITYTSVVGLRDFDLTVPPDGGGIHREMAGWAGVSAFGLENDLVP
jgi:hypothetical protein